MGWLSGGVWLILAALPLALWVAVSVRPGVTMSSRRVPSDTARLTVLVAFVAWVNPFWGICAALAAWHWMDRGWTALEGGLMWPTIAMAFAMGLLVAPGWLDAALALALAIGVLETMLAVAQWLGAPVFMPPQPPRVGRWRPKRLVEGEVMVHGTLGHRTGLGLYLALLLPLGFLTDYGLALACVYALGLFLTQSLVAWAAAFAGLVVLAPASLLWTAPVVGIGVATRLFVRKGWRLSPLHWSDSWRARWRLWGTALGTLRRWPRWLIGHGASTFSSDSRQWLGRTKMVEVYREAHNEYVEFAYEYGVLGCAAMTGFAVTLYPAVAWKDPVTASAAALSVAMLGQFPLRVAPILGLGGLVTLTLMRRLG